MHRSKKKEELRKFWEESKDALGSCNDDNCSCGGECKDCECTEQTGGICRPRPTDTSK